MPATFHSILAILQTGVHGRVGHARRQAAAGDDLGGAGAKDVTGKAITQIVKASGDNKQALLNCRTSELDVEGGFRYVRLSLTVGTAASHRVGACCSGSTSAVRRLVGVQPGRRRSERLIAPRRAGRPQTAPLRFRQGETMKRVRMLQDHQGAREGDVVGYESDAEADALVAAAAAVAVRFDIEAGAYVDVVPEQPAA
jgi:hypothetical protein